MKNSTSDALEGIEFYLRSPEPPTRYTLFLRISDAWAGYRDASRLSAAQLAKHDSEASLPELTSWAHGTLARAAQVEAKERTVHEGAVDPARREITRLTHVVHTATATASTAAAAAHTVEEEGPESSEPISAAEALDSEAVRIGRRDRTHRGRIAGHLSRAAAAEGAATAASSDLAVLETRMEGANKALDHRLTEYQHYTRRRLAVYARAITGRHPDAAIISALTTALVEDEPTLPHPPALRAL